MMSAMRLQQTILVLATFALIAGCGRSHVVREPARGSRSAAGEHPIKVSEPKYGATVKIQRGQNV